MRIEIIAVPTTVYEATIKDDVGKVVDRHYSEGYELLESFRRRIEDIVRVQY